MNATEIAHRVREKYLHHTEARDRAGLESFELGAARHRVPLPPPATDAPEAWRTQLARDSAALSSGNWTLYGWRSIILPLPPPWQSDPLQGIDVSSRTSSKLDHRRLVDDAEVRHVWEINRWAEMVRLGMHGYVNDEPAAFSTARSWLADWCHSNPPGEGINWTSALEAGLRLINFCWFDALHECHPVEEQQRLAQKIVPTHAWWIHRYLSTGSSANNHRLGELTALLMAARRWPELETITGSPGQLWRSVEEAILQQFSPDGGNREQALHYHLFAWEMGLQACRAMNISDGPVWDRLRAAAHYFISLVHADEPWDFGDSDDAQITPVTLHRDRAAAEWARWMNPSSEHDSISGPAYWLGAFPSPVASDTESAITLFPNSGMAAMHRGHWTLRLDASPLGFGKLAAHGHGDALHLSVWDGSEALIIDPGTGSYFSQSAQRRQFASWEAHNGPQPAAGFRTPTRAGPFLWTQHHAVPQLNADEAQGRLRAEFLHEGYSCTRAVTFKDEDSLLIEDKVSPAALVVRWHLAPECTVSVIAPTTVVISRGSHSWRLRSFSVEDQAPTIHLCTGKASPHFGQVVCCPVLEITANSGILRTELQRLEPSRTPASVHS